MGCVPLAFLTARGAPPPLALARRRRYAALPSSASLGPQALLTARGAPPPLALARQRRYAALPSSASLGPQALSLSLVPCPLSLVPFPLSLVPFPLLYLLIKFRNSDLVRASLRNAPSIALVTATEFCFSTPRIDMHRWVASVTTATPSGLILAVSVSAI
jgi:hypothetical protein